MEHTDKKRREGILLVVALLLFVFFSECPLQKMVGIPCPGCNMSTAIYYLLQGQVQVALFYHPLCILLVVFAFVEGVLYLKYKTFYHRIGIYLFWTFIVLLLVVYCIRMVVVFPQIPMVYVEDNVWMNFKALFF